MECGIAAGFLRSGRMLADASNCAAVAAAAGEAVAYIRARRLSIVLAAELPGAGAGW